MATRLNSTCLTAPQSEPLWTPQQVATFLSITPRHVRDLAKEGVLPAIQVSGRWRFHPRDVRAFARVE